MIGAVEEDDVLCPPSIRFTSAKLSGEWYAMRPELQALIARADAEWAQLHRLPVIVTHILRTHAGHVRIYTPRHGANPAKWPANVPRVSPHEPGPDGAGRACDLRCRDYTKGEREALVAWFNANGPKRKDGKPTALCHDVGAGLHFHVQVPR